MSGPMLMRQKKTKKRQTKGDSALAGEANTNERARTPGEALDGGRHAGRQAGRQPKERHPRSAGGPGEAPRKRGRARRHSGPGAKPPHGPRPATHAGHGAPPRLPRQGRELRKLLCSG